MFFKKELFTCATPMSFILYIYICIIYSILKIVLCKNAQKQGSIKK